jgi:arsenite-transporting ATPase
VSVLRELLDSLPPLTLVVGKGGTGKTTLSLGVATHLAHAGHRVLVLSTDPAGTLGDAIGLGLGDATEPVPQVPSLDARQLSARAERERFLQRWRDVIATILDRGTYLDAADIDGVVDAAFPGADEIFAVLALASTVREARYDRVVVDTAPTGHTLRLLALPRTFDAIVALLESMQEKHRFMVQALTHRYRRDAADEFLDEMRDTIGALRGALSDPTRSSAIVVGRAESVVAAETGRLLGALDELHVATCGVIVNAMPTELDDASRQAVDTISRVAPATPHFALPLRLPQPGADGAAALLESLTPLARMEIAPVARSTRRTRSRSASALAPRLARELTIVGGKGGVGKTSVSCAVALAAAEAGGRVLLVSTDPAPSIADALGQPIGDEETRVDDVHGGELRARQMDAAAAFQRFRLEYEARVDELFGALVATGVDASYDRAIVRDLLALSPPGIDEIFALSVLGETLSEARFTHVVVDPAPTGHLLRLLEMPALALDWSRQIMRLMLKYKEVVGLGDAAEEILAFSRRTRTLETLMRDATRCGLIAVSLDEPVVREETMRLVAAVRALGVDVIGLLWNRVEGPPDPLPSDVPLEQLVSPRRVPPPTGVPAMRDWSRDWVSLEAR